MTAPSITLTRLDVQRLERLIDSLDDTLQGVIALQTELDRADTVVGHDEVPADVVTMNSRVHCREEGSGKDYHLTLVYPKDANADEGKISILAPVGSALLGLKVGQHIDWPAPGGKTLKLTLLKSNRNGQRWRVSRVTRLRPVRVPRSGRAPDQPCSADTDCLNSARHRAGPKGRGR